MDLDLGQLDRQHLDAAARFYEIHGYLQLSGLREAVTSLFRPILADVIGVDAQGVADFLDPLSPPVVLPLDTRRRLGRLQTSPGLSADLLAALRPLLLRLIGPLVHVSSTFHGQLKGGAVKEVDHGGYADDYLEVHGPYLLHQDFTGANLPTSPSALTLWVALNSCPHWTLRLYPGSHRHGLLCQRWLPLEDPRLVPFGEPLDIQAREGTAVLFNALLLHGTSNPGPLRRVSCDIRFFPLCGFLPSAVHCLDRRQNAALAAGLEQAGGPVMRAPLLEDRAFLGEKVALGAVPLHSVLNWVKYVADLVQGETTAALPHLERFVNTEAGFDPPGAYTSKFHGRPLEQAALQRVREQLGLIARTGPESLRGPHFLRPAREPAASSGPWFKE
jgi:hypothetical protein